MCFMHLSFSTNGDIRISMQNIQNFKLIMKFNYKCINTLAKLHNVPLIILYVELFYMLYSDFGAPQLTFLFNIPIISHNF